MLLVEKRCVVAGWALYCTATFSFAASVTEVFGTGWACRLVPNSIYGPGVIYQETPQGIRLVKDLTSEPGFVTRLGQAAVGEITDVREIGSELSASLWNKLLQGLTAAVSASARKTQRSSITYEIDKYSVTDDDFSEKALTWAQSHLKPSRSTKYYLIREAISAKAVNYLVDDGLGGTLGVSVSNDKLLKVNAQLLRASNNGSYFLRKILNPPLWACSVADELRAQASLTGDIEWELISAQQPAALQNQF